MATASLGITVETSGVEQAVAGLDKIAPAAQRAEQATAKLAASTSTTMGAAANQIDTFASRIEKALNIKATGIDMGRGADIAAYGAELDRLRQKFNQAHQIMSQYRTAAGEIRQANAVGAISINEMNAALERLRTTTQRQIETERQLRQGRMQQGGMGGAGGVPGRGGGAQQMMQSNLMYQFQDIAVTTAMGMNPAMIALQQGTQIGAAMTAAGGAKAGIAGLTGALGSMLSVTNLLPIAIIGVGAAMFQWLTGADEKVKTADEAMKDYTKSVDEMGKAWGAAIEIQNRGAGESLANFRGSQEALRGALRTEAPATLEKFGSMRTFESFGETFEMFMASDAKYTPFNEAIDTFYKSIQNGTPQANNFVDSVNKIGDEGGPAVRKVADEVIYLNYKLIEAGRNLQIIEPIIRTINDMVAGVRGGNILGNERGRYPFIEPSAERFGGNERGDRQQKLDEWNRQQAATLEIFKLQNGALTDQQRIQAAIAAAREQGLSDRSLTNQQRLILEQNAALKEQLTIAEEIRVARQDQQVANERAISGQQIQIQNIGKTAGEQAALNYQYQKGIELQDIYLRTGRDASQEQINAIKATAAELGKLVDLQKQMQLQADLAFERSLIYMSREEQQIAQRLRGTGLSTTGPEANEMRSQNREREILDFSRSTAKDFLSSFSDVLIEGGDDMGEKLVQALVGSAQRTLDKVLDKLLDNLVDALLGTGKGGGGGGGGIIDSVVESLVKSGAKTGGGASTSSVADVVSSIVTGGGGAGASAKGLSTTLGLAPYAEMVEFARNAAIARGIDPNVAVNLMKHEGLQPGIWQSLVQGPKGRETSYGPMQLLRGGGLGDAFNRETGLDVSDPRTWRQNIEFGLNKAATGGTGWQPWYGRGPAGIGQFEGLGGSHAVDLTKSVDTLKTSLEGASAAVDTNIVTAAKASMGLAQVGQAGGSAANSLSTVASALSKFPAAPAAPAGGGGGGGLFGWISSLFGMSANAISPAASAFLTANPGGYVGLWHEGNYGASSARSRYFPSMSPWVNAPRLHSGNMFGAGEYPAVLNKGEPVFPSMGAAKDAMGGKTTVNINNYAGADVSVKERKTNEGLTLDVMVDRMVAQQIDQRGTASNNAIRGKFGVSEKLRQR